MLVIATAAAQLHAPPQDPSPARLGCRCLLLLQQCWSSSCAAAAAASYTHLHSPSLFMRALRACSVCSVCAQVKEAFRKLVWQYHPDKAAPDVRATAEAKFKEVRVLLLLLLPLNAAQCWPPALQRPWPLQLFLPFLYQAISRTRGKVSCGVLASRTAE